MPQPERPKKKNNNSKMPDKCLKLIEENIVFITVKSAKFKFYYIIVIFLSHIVKKQHNY